MRIVFMGSAEISCPSLDAVLAGDRCDLVGVVTQPDSPSGRGRRVTACPVREHVQQLGIPVLTPGNVNAADSVRMISNLKPDLVVVVAYGQILREPVLSIPPMGCINVHASLLPRYRGAAPIQWAIANGDSVTGVTTMYMNRGTDTGDIILQKEVAIDPSDTAGSLHDKLAIAGAGLLMKTIAGIGSGRLTAKSQDDSLATYAPKIGKLDGRIDWTKDAGCIYNRVRAFNPWPCCFCLTGETTAGTLRVLKARAESAEKGEPGELLEWSGDGPLVRAGAGAVRLLEVQPSGRKVMDGRAYVNGYGSPGRFL